MFVLLAAVPTIKTLVRRPCVMLWLIAFCWVCSLLGSDDQPVDWALKSPESGEPVALVSKLELHTMKINGSHVSLSTTTKNQWPGQEVCIDS